MKKIVCDWCGKTYDIVRDDKGIGVAYWLQLGNIFIDAEYRRTEEKEYRGKIYDLCNDCYTALEKNSPYQLMRQH